jgi:pyruvate carboxylase
MRPIHSILVANRSEIAIRVMRAAAELGIRTIAIYSHEDRFALHRFKADESYLVGAGKKPLQAYLDIQNIIRIAREAKVDAIHPGYGFLSENPEFAKACVQAGIRFIGPTPEVMVTLGNKVAARNAAMAAGVPVMPATDPLPNTGDEAADIAAACAAAARIGYPVMLKASWGGGGRGMRMIDSDAELQTQLPVARREAAAAFGNDEVYLEKLVRRARHVEVQIMGDLHGQLVHLFERDCSVQRRNQKVVERAPAPYLSEAQRQALCQSALKLGSAVGYTHAGTVEFLMDADTEQFYFIEVNPRIQVEHTVTEQVTGIDIVKSQIRITEGARIGASDCPVPQQADIRLNGHALQCRVTTEDPENNFTPDYGRITAYRSAAGFGVRLDGGTAYSGAVITPYYDSLLVKVTTSAPSAAEAIKRMDRALREFRIRGVSTNLQFVENVINHPDFAAGTVTTRFIDSTPELFRFAKRRDRASRVLRYIGEVIVNGQPDMKGRTAPDLSHHTVIVPSVDRSLAPPAGHRERLAELGAQGFADWMKEHPRVLVTDTTMRDAHQSLLATRVRTRDLVDIAPAYARLAPGLLSVECWGGATFDVAMRFLKEDPWQRLEQLRVAMPNMLLQMLVRASNAVGYTNYPDQVVRHFIAQAARGDGKGPQSMGGRNGIDLFRLFDSLNWVENMRVAIDAVLDSGALCEGSVCYTADIFDQHRKYPLGYYLKIARELKAAGVHILGIKDMAGVCRPRAAAELVRALKAETGLPVHFHTHDTSGAGAAAVLAAVEAGADAVDAALDAMSGLTAQPSLGSLVAALEGTARAPDLDRSALLELSTYWEGVRQIYAPFEADIRAGTSDVYNHEMPGGQYTNLREQARAMGLEHRWPEVSRRYAEVNLLFGDIVKVTPTSKVVGDMALYMVANDLNVEQVMDPAREISVPESVVALFKGELGFPPDGFPEAVSRRILRCDTAAPLMASPPKPFRPGDLMAPVDMDAQREAAQKAAGHAIDERQLASYLMYPKVFREFHEHLRAFGDTSVLPSRTFFYGMAERDEIAVDIDPGKTLVIRMLGLAPLDDEGQVRVFFELNGQPRTLRIERAGASRGAARRPQAESGNPFHVAAPMPGMVVTVAVKPGQAVQAGDPLVSLEAMKMESQIRSERDGIIAAIHVRSGETVAAHDLLIEFKHA